MKNEFVEYLGNLRLSMIIKVWVLYARWWPTTRCKLHRRALEKDLLPVQYGLFRFRPEYLKAKSKLFPHARKFALGGCRPGPRLQREVLFCPACREAESRWHKENPDFNDPAIVLSAVTSDRRGLSDSLAKRILKQSQLETPEKIGPCVWIVYRINLYECVAYNAERKTYQHLFETSDYKSYETISQVADALNNRFGE